MLINIYQVFLSVRISKNPPYSHFSWSESWLIPLVLGAWWMWASFFALVLLMIAADLQLLGGKKAHKVTLKEAAGWSVAWMAVALVFNGALWWYLDGTAGRDVANEKSLEFLTG